MAGMRHSSFLRLPSTEVHLVDSGGSGMPYVLIHGLGGNHANWIEVFDGLAARSRVIAVDLPGYGYSPPIARHDLDQLTNVLIELLETFGEPSVLIGNSMGGLLAEMVAAARPSLVDDMALIAPASPIVSIRHRPRIAVAARLAAQSFPWLGTPVVEAYRRRTSPQQRAEILLDLVAADASLLPERVRSASYAMAHRRAAMPWATRALVESTASMRRMFVPPGRFRRMIASIGHEALVLSGDRDTLVEPGAIDALEVLRPDWTFRRRAGIGHVPQMEAAEWVLEEIDTWMARSSNSTSQAT